MHKTAKVITEMKTETLKISWLTIEEALDLQVSNTESKHWQFVQPCTDIFWEG